MGEPYYSLRPLGQDLLTHVLKDTRNVYMCGVLTLLESALLDGQIPLYRRIGRNLRDPLEVGDTLSITIALAQIHMTKQIQSAAFDFSLGHFPHEELPVADIRQANQTDPISNDRKNFIYYVPNFLAKF